MKALFLTLVFGLVTALQAQDPLSFALDGPDNTETWFVKAMVMNKSLPKEKRPKEMPPLTVEALDGGDLELSFTFMKKGHCHERRMVMQRMAEPGVYSISGDRYCMKVEQLPVEGHYIMYYEDRRRRELFHVGKLMGRNLDINPEALEAFQRFIQRKGWSPEDIFMPGQMNELSRESESGGGR
ncbi:PREDICTED: odorant-binding protein 2b [Miniopterus natalensis]|uniref:odorant-binding protein 2b n=1 Tax=Miniopterus natalensis TaxID=291302 RepID=UPI0007A712D0|nr:PREDICTED: odorant-binding protein 2b [Miniopterus natalensis]